jgi:cellobiose-specific phosphotransferase system component IIA
MDLVSQAAQVSSQPGVAQSAQIFALNQAKKSSAESVLPLLNSAVQSANEIHASNPDHLGQNVDVTA